MDNPKLNDNISRLRKARRRRNKNDITKYIIIGLAVVLLVLAAVLAGRALKNKGGETVSKGRMAESEATTSEEETTPAETTVSEEELLAQREKEEKQAVVDSYQNLGIVQVSGYLNMRESASTSADVIGKLLGDSACEILDSSTEGWYKISSGGLEGFISSEFVLTGEEAKARALELVDKRAVVTADKLNVRTEPNTEAQVTGQILKNERYAIKGETDGWVEIPSGFVSSEFVEVKYALNEARKLDLRSMVLNLYDNLGISNVNNYLNVRDKPSEDGKIIGKMTSKSGGEILEKSEDGEWYKIKSGPVTGYVKSDYILTGNAAKDEALSVAELMAIVSTDRLNVRTEPSTESKIWTQISNSERYRVLKQVDGWVEIELDSTSAYVATDYVDVRYALNEAIKFTPLEESSSGGKGGSSGGGSSQKASLRTQIVNYALQFSGNPYVWGGTSLTKGADCSGFTMSVLGHFGISLPHHSGSQASRGKSINSSQMRPGDLLFYTNSGGTINHVSMYIGNGQVIHASNARDGIKISTWNYRTPAKIVNVIGD